MTDKPDKVLIIGSGPIIIGQAAEFDYAGTQACKAMREEGVTSVLVNSNPATIMTDEGIADIVYIEPLTVDVVARIIERERPDGLLPTLGGQTGLNLAVALAEAGVLDKYNVRLLGTPIETIRKAEDRELFKQLLRDIGEPVPDSATVTSMEEARHVLDRSACRWSSAPPTPSAAPAAAWPTPGRSSSRSSPAAWRSAPSTRCWWSAGCWAGKKSSTRSCATPPTTASPSATWKTSTRWASTPATASSSRPARP